MRVIGVFTHWKADCRNEPLINNPGTTSHRPYVTVVVANPDLIDKRGVAVFLSTRLRSTYSNRAFLSNSRSAVCWIEKPGHPADERSNRVSENDRFRLRLYTCVR